jgi:phosphatidylglycerol:prolipoprotein diacylglycerol transferase
LKPIPVVFHIGPLPVHTYGIGLALTFWIGYRYFCKRLRDNGYPDAWFGGVFVWVVVAAVVGARAVHVIAHASYYQSHPADVFAVWQGGLSSFGGLLLALPVGIVLSRRRCPELGLAKGLDLLAPVLALCWAIGRLLGPQLMVAGGGKPTSAWYGMYYAGQAGKRLPVPVFQAIECTLVYVLALAVERFIHRRGGPAGVVVAATAAFWGLTRFVDERFWLTQDSGTDAVEVASLAFVAAGAATVAILLWRDARRRLPQAAVPAGDPEGRAAEAATGTPPDPVTESAAAEAALDHRMLETKPGDKAPVLGG